MLVNRGAGQPSFDVPAPFLTAEQMLPVREHLTRLLAADIEDELPDLDAECRPQGAEQAPDRAEPSQGSAPVENGGEAGRPG